MTEPNPARPDDGPIYTAMDGPELLEACRDNAANWAKAFCQHAERLGHPNIDEGWMIGWFANAIEQSSHIRAAPSTSRDDAEGTGEAAARYEFPYQRTFEAIAAATSLYPSKDAALGISVSVQKFQDAFNNYRDARLLAPPKPAPDALRALEPFAKVAEAFDSWPGIKRQPDGANICTFFTASGRLADAATINYGHCRKARAALDALSAPVPSPDALREINAASPNPCKQPWNCVWPACGVGPLGNCGKQGTTAPAPPPDGARHWPRVFNVKRAENAWHAEISFARHPTDAELQALEISLRDDRLPAPALPSPAEAAEPMVDVAREFKTCPTCEMRQICQSIEHCAGPSHAELKERGLIPCPAVAATPSLPDREELAQAAAQRFFGSKLKNLEGASMDACRDHADDVRGMMRGASTGEQGYHKLDNERQVFFYEQDFYVLSNFSSFRLEWKGRHFDTSEAAYHWEKFVGNDPLRILIKCANSAYEAFKIAETNRDTRRPDWDAVKVNIMRGILQAKADQHEYVRRKLLATDNRELIEDSWRDDFWGWGPNRDGQNMLGKLWMEIRDELRARQPPHSGSKREGRG